MSFKAILIAVVLILMAFGGGYGLGYWKLHVAEKEWAAAKGEMQAKISGMEAGEGSFSARIIDPLCPWNEGTWNFSGREGRLQVSKASQVDCDLTIQGLTALIAGVHEPQDIPLRGWGNPDPEMQSSQRILFPPLVPYMHEMF